MSTNLIGIIKKVAVEAVEASNPVAVLFGSVVSTSPLKINVEQRLVVTKEFIRLTNSVTGENELKANDNVVLLRTQGGQQYIVIDKLV